MISWMTVADEFVSELADELDGWRREIAAGCLEAAERLPTGPAEASLLFDVAMPIMLLAVKLGKGDLPGSDLEVDAGWATAAAFARQEVLARQAAGLDHGTAARSLALIDRINALTGDWPEPDWSAATAARVSESMQARRSGRARGQQLRQNRAPEPESEPTTAGWFLRHPTDQRFRIAFNAVRDPGLRAPLGEWISALNASYTTLAKQDWSTEEAQADLVAEVLVTDAQAPRWVEPAKAVVLYGHAGDVQLGSTLAVCQVADPDAQFNGTLVSTLPQERWQICGHRRDDGSILVTDGTRRLQPAS
jgi:hypothetical protein